MQRELDEFSLWLELPVKEYALLRATIEQVATRLRTVTFVPHVTLLGGIPRTISEIQKAMLELVSQKSFEVTLSNISIGSNRYQCLIAECEKSADLMDCNAHAQKLCGMSEQYHPHLSLMYGDAELEIKEGLQDELRGELQLPLTFEATTVSLWHIKGSADQWKKISEVNLAAH